MTTVLDIVTNAMEECGVLTKSEAPTNEEAQSGLKRLNRLISSWSNSDTLVYERTTESFTLSSGTSAYTMGSGGDFNTTRPVKIVESHVRQGTTDYPLALVSDSIYQSIAVKSTGGLPEYINFTNEYPLATINLYPTPSTAYTLFITSEKPFSEYASINSTVDLPPGWEDALTYNLAVRLCGIYGQPVDQSLSSLARESKAMIALNTVRNNPFQSQVTSARAVNNIYSGYGR